MKELQDTWSGMRSIKDFTTEELQEQIRHIESLEYTDQWCDLLVSELEVAQKELERRKNS